MVHLSPVSILAYTTEITYKEQNNCRENDFPLTFTFYPHPMYQKIDSGITVYSQIHFD